MPDDGGRALRFDAPRTLHSETRPLPPPARRGGVLRWLPQGRRQRWRWALFSLLPVALLAVGLFWALSGGTVTTDNAYIRTDKVGISTDVSGIVTEVAVSENQTVAAGQVLFRLDDQPLRLALTRAEAQVGIVHNELEALKASWRDMQAQIAQAENDTAYYDRELARHQTLASRQVVAAATLDLALRNQQNAQHRLASLREQLAAITANLSGNPDLPVEQHPRYRDAVAQRDEARRQLDHAVVRAPFAGIVTSVPSLAPGKYLTASTTAFYLVAADHAWIDANPKETQLTDVRPGQPVTIAVDAYPGVTWHGTVDSISPAAAQEFALLPAQNASGNWVKVVQRIPLRVRIDTSDASRPTLRTGMSVEIEIDTAAHGRTLQSSAPPAGRPQG